MNTLKNDCGPDLLPCPFCGGKPYFVRLGSFRVSCIISCEDCGCKAETNEEPPHIGEHWNSCPRMRYSKEEFLLLSEWVVRNGVYSGDKLSELPLVRLQEMVREFSEKAELIQKYIYYREIYGDPSDE